MENVINKKEGNTAFDSLHLLLSIFIIFWFNDGLFTFINGYWWIRYIKLIVLFLWFLLAWARDKMFITKYFKLSFPLILFIVIVRLEKLFGAEDYISYANVMINNSTYMLIITALFCFFLSNGSRKEKKMLVYAWFLDVAICGVITLKEINDNPMISRFLTTADPSLYIGKNVLAHGVLSFGHAYAFVFAIVALCSGFKKTTNSRRLIFVGLIVYIFYLILKMQFAFAFLLSIFALIVSVYISLFNNAKNYFVIFLPAILLLLWLFAENIIDFTIGMIGGQQELVNKLNEIKGFLANRDLIGTDLFSRLIRYNNSFKTIFSTYLIGSLLMGTGEIGEHSELLDAFATYGVIPTTFLVYFFIGAYKSVKSQLKSKMQRFFKFNFVLFLMLSIINTSLWSSIMNFFLLIVPMIYLVLDHNNSEQNE